MATEQQESSLRSAPTTNSSDARGTGIRRRIRSIGRNLRYRYRAGNANRLHDPERSDPPGWMIRANGKQYGPYDTDFLLWMVSTDQIEADAALAWRPGMSTWEPLIAVPELSGGMP